MNRRTLRTLAFLALALTPAVALPQSLADTAKKEQARRKKAASTTPKKVYTESDLPASPAAGAATAVDDKGGGANQVASTSARNEESSAANKEAADREAATALKAQVAEIKERIAEAEEVVKRLANHPTGGGKVCRIPEGVFQPGVTAAETVVCPYEMESRYDRAKRELAQTKAELAALASEARRLRVVL